MEAWRSWNLAAVEIRLACGRDFGFGLYFGELDSGVDMKVPEDL